MKIDGILCDLIGEIGLVDGNDPGLVGRNSLKRPLEVIGTVNNVVHADDPKALTVSFERHGPVAKNIETVAVERLGDNIGTVRVVMITKNRNHGRFG